MPSRSGPCGGAGTSGASSEPHADSEPATTSAEAVVRRTVVRPLVMAVMLAVHASLHQSRSSRRRLTRVVAPSGEQYEISGSGYRAVVTECGAGLRLLEHEGRALVDGYAEQEMAVGGRGQLLVPWPNRIRDGHYAVGDRQLQLPLSEPARHNASH